MTQTAQQRRGRARAPRALAGHFASLGRFIAQHEQRAEGDTVALAELCAGAAATLELPAGLEIEWLGVAGYRLTYEGQTIYLDPYVSRVPFAAFLRGRPALPDSAAIERWLAPVGQVRGVLVGHTHFDHAVDVPALCERHGCKAYGSSSLVQLMSLYGRREQAVQVVAHEAIELGPFRVTFVPSVHSKLLLGYRVPSDGELTCEHLDALSPGAYRCGQVWGIHIEVAGFTLYHQGSANLLDEEIRHRGVDAFLAGIAGRRFTDSYWQRILGALQPRVVVASHFDDFFRTLEQPAGFSLNVNLAAFPEEITAVSREFAVAALPAFTPVGAESAR
jgi:L-ascorbate metabolism protein UlaG (beta-lactamase superfamily)